MLTVPYTLQYHRPFHTAEGDVCVSWRSLFLTELHIRAQMCLEDLKTQIPHPHPKQNKNPKKGEKTPSWGPLCKLGAVPFYFKISWQMTKTNI